MTLNPTLRAALRLVLTDPAFRCILAVAPHRELLRAFYEYCEGNDHHFSLVDLKDVAHEPALLIADTAFVSNDLLRAMQTTFGLPQMSDDLLAQHKLGAFGPPRQLNEALADLESKLNLESVYTSQVEVGPEDPS